MRKVHNAAIATDDPEALSVCQSIWQPRGVDVKKMAERIEVLCGVETLGDLKHAVLDGYPDFPGRGRGSVVQYRSILCTFIGGGFMLL